MEAKLFTIEEANAAIPYLEDRLGTLQHLLRRIIQLRPTFDVLQLICSGPLDQGNADRRQLRKVSGEYHRLIGEADMIIHEIRERGMLLRDVRDGIVDFYSRHDDQAVYLCWRKGEQHIAFWHPVREDPGKRRPFS